jgi:hypothetical protein
MWITFALASPSIEELNPNNACPMPWAKAVMLTKFSAEARDWRADGTGRDAGKYSQPDYKRCTAHGCDWRTIGVGSALTVSKMLKALLFGVSTSDPLTFISVPVLLTLVALVAILMAARAGMRVDPAVTLRAEWL